MRNHIVQLVSGIQRYVLIAALVVQYNPVSAQHAGYTALSDPAAFKSNFKQESSNVISIQSNFTQEKILSALTEKIVSKGKFWFKRSNKVRIEYTKPFVYLMVMNGDKMLIRDEQKESRINVKVESTFSTGESYHD